MERFISGELLESHGRRVRFFRSKDLPYQENQLLVLQRMEGIRERKEAVEIFVKRKGILAEEDNWVSISSLSEGVLLFSKSTWRG